MEKEEIFETLRNIIVDQSKNSSAHKIDSRILTREDIDLHAVIRDELDLDSLDIVEIAMRVEETFSIIVPEEVIPKIITVEDAVNMIREKISLWEE